MSGERPPAAPASALAFTCDASDHCETSQAAYADIAPIVDFVVGGKTKRPSLEVYDPYYCQGGAVRRLNALGFGRVYNRNEDFYKAIKTQRTPAHDVLLSNPPFSADHIRRAVHFACAQKNKKDKARSMRRRPWFLLLPNHVYCSDWFPEMMQRHGEQPMYLCPRSGRYHFDSQYDLGKGSGSGQKEQARRASSARGSSTEARVCPFPTLWYIGGLGETVRADLVQWFGSDDGRAAHGDTSTLAASTEELPKRIRKLERYAKKKGRKSKGRGKEDEKKRQPRLGQLQRQQIANSGKPAEKGKRSVPTAGDGDGRQRKWKRRKSNNGVCS